MLAKQAEANRLKKAIRINDDLREFDKYKRRNNLLSRLFCQFNIFKLEQYHFDRITEPNFTTAAFTVNNQET